MAFASSHAPPSAPPRERRTDARVPLQAEVTATFCGQSHRWWLREISSTGALILRGAAPRPARLHRIALDVGQAEPLRLLARTVRSVGTFHAVRFVALDDLDRLELAEVVDRLRSERAS